jgi:hypothetical protein
MIITIPIKTSTRTHPAERKLYGPDSKRELSLSAGDSNEIHSLIHSLAQTRTLIVPAVEIKKNSELLYMFKVRAFEQ